MVQSTVNLFGSIAGFGLGLTASKHIAEFRRTDAARAGRLLGLANVVAFACASLLAVSLIVAGPILAAATLHSSALGTPLQLASIFLFFTAINGAQIGALAGLEAFAASAVAALLAAVVNVFVVVLVAPFGSVSCAVLGLGISSAVGCAITHAFLHRCCVSAGVRADYAGWSSERSVLFRFSAPAALGGMLVAPVNWAAMTFLASAPSGYGQLGIFSAANQWRAAILFVPGTLGSVFLPVLSGLHAAKETRNFTGAAKLGFAVNGVAALLAAAPLLVFAHPIMSHYGPGFSDGVPTFRLVVVASVIVAMNNHTSRIVASSGRMWISFGFDAAWSLAYLASAYYLSATMGALGLAVATLFAAIVQSVWQCMYLYGSRTT